MVKLKPNESFESLMKRFKKQVLKDNVLIDYKKHEYYVSKGQKKRLKHEAAVKKANKKNK